MTYLNDIWSFYFHDPHDHNWDLKSYTFIKNISTVNDFIEILYVFKQLLNNGMFFIMREHITPRWEDDNNITGGCFSFKIGKHILHDKILEICSQILGETLGKTDKLSMNINGISISPKRNYYIVRIWIKDKKFASFNNYNIKVPKFSTLMYKNHAEE